MEAVNVTFHTGQLPPLFVGLAMPSQLDQGLGLVQEQLLLPSHQH